MSDLEKEADDWITRNMSWDHYESDWINSGIKTYIAGVMAERERILKAMDNWLRANPETSFHVNATGWQLFDYIKDKYKVTDEQA